jgi:hypothetical protein
VKPGTHEDASVSDGVVRNARLRFGTLCILGYVALSWMARFDMRLGDQIASVVYPFDTFSMYAGIPSGQSSAMLVRDADGGVHRVTAFRAFSCADRVGSASAAGGCPVGIQYLHEDLVSYIQHHAGSGSREVDVIARTWEIRRGAAPVTTSDCVIVHCKVSP